MFWKQIIDVNENQQKKHGKRDSDSICLFTLNHYEKMIYIIAALHDGIEAMKAVVLIIYLVSAKVERRHYINE